jgi:hypothetical protein
MCNYAVKLWRPFGSTQPTLQPRRADVAKPKKSSNRAA